MESWSSLFDPLGFQRAPVLSFLPERAPRELQHEAQRFLLWPALAYQVVAPQARRRALDLFQRATLRLCQAGCFAPDAIAAHLDLSPALIAHIIAAAQQQGWLDSHGALSAAGAALLEAEEVERHELIAGWVFQDPFQGDLWPVLHQGTLPALERGAPKRGGLPTVQLGTKGRPRFVEVLALALEEDAAQRPPPSAAQVVRAAHDDDEGEAGAEALGRVSVLSERGQPVWLLSYLFTPREPIPEVPWLVMDPFAPRASARLRREVLARRREDEGLRQELNRLLELHDAHDEEIAEQEGYFNDRRLEKALLEVERRLSGSPPAPQALRQHLCDMEESRLEAEVLEGRQAARALRRRGQALIEAQRALERACTLLRGRFPVGPGWRQLDPQPQQKDHNQRLLNDLARRLGFTVPLPDSLVFVKPGKVRQAAQGGGATLRPLLIVLLFAAQHRDDHPLRAAAQRHPDLLARLDALAALRDDNAHASSERGRGERPSAAELRAAIDTTYQAIALLGS